VALTEYVKRYGSRRDWLLIDTLTYTGARISEVLALTPDDVDVEASAIRIKQLKKRKEAYKIIPIPRWLARQLAEFGGFHLSRVQAWRIIRYWTERFLGRPVRPHAFRHAYGTYLLRTTKDVELVRRILGHKSYHWVQEYMDYSLYDLQEDLQKAWKVVNALNKKKRRHIDRTDFPEEKPSK